MNRGSFKEVQDVPASLVSDELDLDHLLFPKREATLVKKLIQTTNHPSINTSTSLPFSFPFLNISLDHHTTTRTIVVFELFTRLEECLQHLFK